MSVLSGVANSTPPVNPSDNHAVSLGETSYARVFSDVKIKRLKAIGTALFVFGLLLIVTGVALTAALSNPLFLTIIVIGLMLTVLAGNLLMKAQYLEMQSEVPKEPVRFDPTSESHETDFSTKRSVMILRRHFPQEITKATKHSWKGKVLLRKVFSNGNGCYLGFTKGVIMDLQRGLCEPPNKIGLVFCDQFTESPNGKLIRKCTAEEVFEEIERNRACKRQGEFLAAEWVPSPLYENEHSGLGIRSWDFLYKLNRPTDPNSGCVSLKASFKDLFIDCIKKGITVLQMPPVTCEPSYQQETSSGYAILQALMEALSEVEEMVDPGNPFCVNIVASFQIPFLDVIEGV